MKNPPASAWVSRTGNEGKAIEDRLRVLQNSHRLGIHMVEGKQRQFVVADETLETMGKVKAQDIPQSLKYLKEILSSLTLLPSDASQMTIVPYKVTQRTANNYGYLMNLSMEQPNPPRVVRVSPHNLYSDYDASDKHLQLEMLFDRRSPFTAFHAYLESFYRRITGFEGRITLAPQHYLEREKPMLANWEERIIQAAGGEAGLRNSEEQLNAIGRLYEQEPEKFREYSNKPDDGICRKLNEILVACHPEHIAAIVVPSFRGETNISPSVHDARVTLQAALVGLDHLLPRSRLPQPAPVVIYHIDKPQGRKYSFVGQSVQELKVAALESLLTLGEDGISQMRREAMRDRDSAATYGAMALQIRLLLHLDINDRSRDDDNRPDWLAQATEKLASLKARAAQEAEPGLQPISQGAMR